MQNVGLDEENIDTYQQFPYVNVIFTFLFFFLFSLSLIIKITDRKL